MKPQIASLCTVPGPRCPSVETLVTLETGLGTAAITGHCSAPNSLMMRPDRNKTKCEKVHTFLEFPPCVKLTFLCFWLNSHHNKPTLASELWFYTLNWNYVAPDTLSWECRSICMLPGDSTVAVFLLKPAPDTISTLATGDCGDHCAPLKWGIPRWLQIAS